jgi:hypothetical protein
MNFPKVDDGGASFADTIELERVGEAIQALVQPKDPPAPPKEPAKPPGGFSNMHFTGK